MESSNGAAAPVAVAPTLARPNAPRVAPHSGVIGQLALTDRGTAAFTSDAFDQLRLWTTVDGTREPVIVEGPAPTQIALAETSDGFAVAILDVAGGLTLIRFDPVGQRMGGRTLPPEPGFVRVMARGDSFVATLRDERIVLLDAAGGTRGTLAPEPGDRVVAIAVRGERALAFLEEPGGGTKRARWITFAPQLAWGAARDLGQLVVGPFALAPHANRIAAFEAARHVLHVIDLDTGKVMHEYAGAFGLPHVFGDPEPGTLGFLADDVVVATNGSAVHWWRPAAAKGGAPATIANAGIGAIAFADGVMVSASGINLMLTDERHTWFVGYRDTAQGDVQPVDDGVAVTTGSSVYWLDRDLAVRQSIAVNDAMVLDAHHVATIADSHVAILDVRTKTTTRTEMPAATVRILRHDAGTLTSVVDRVAARWQIELDPVRASALSPIEVGEPVTTIALDPALADGFVLVTSAYVPLTGRYVLSWFPPPASPRPVVRRDIGAIGTLIGVDRAGRFFVVNPAGESEGRSMLVAFAPDSAEKGERQLPLPSAAVNGTVARDGSFVVVTDGSAMRAVDAASGAVRWRAPLWGLPTPVLTDDGRTVVVRGSDGLQSFDAATGKRLAIACAWSFGRSETALSAGPFGTANVCSHED